MHRLTITSHDRFVLTTLVAICVAIVLGACADAPGTQAPTDMVVPAWSPPSWMWGTWEGRTAIGEIRVEASKYNLVYTSGSGGATLVLDLAQITEEGILTVRHDAGVWTEGPDDLYYELILTSGSAAPTYLFFSKVSATAIKYWTTNPTNNTVYNPTTLTKQ